MSSVVLANELLNLILGHIDPNSSEGRQSLYACSLANHALRSIAQPQLFRCINISYKFNSRSSTDFVLIDAGSIIASRFLDLITTSPLIASYVQELTVHLFPESRRDRGVSPRTCSDAEAFSLYAIMPRLLKLRKFTVQSSISFSFDWHLFEKRTRDFFLDVVSLVQELDLESLGNFPIAAFHGRHNLHSLRVPNLAWEPADTMQSTDDKVELDSLYVGYYSLCKPFEETIKPCFTSPWSPFDVTHLRVLQLANPRFAGYEINELLALCSNTLESLSLSLDVLGVSAGLLALPHLEPPDLSSLQNLRHLTLKTPIFGPRYQQPLSDLVHNNNDLLHIASILNTLPFDKHSCEYPVLQVDLLFTVINMPNFVMDFPLLPWTEVIEVLNNLCTSGYLKGVEIVIQRLERSKSIPGSALYDILDHNEGLKALRQSGILTASCSIFSITL